jgi:hypothetical protein
MTFSKNRNIFKTNTNNTNNKFELLRYCTKINNNIIDGASKLFNYFKLNYNPTEIIYYDNRRFLNKRMPKNQSKDARYCPCARL